MNNQITQTSFTHLVDWACQIDRELRLELEREKEWDIYGETLGMAYERFKAQGVTIREAFGLSYSSAFASQQPNY